MDLDTQRGTFTSGPLAVEDAALLTDLYELTMAASYFHEGMDAAATFSLFVRRLPAGRSFLVAAGLEDVLNYLQGFSFSDQAIVQLAGLSRFEAGFLDFLHAMRFTGEVRAVPEGTIVFADEPLLEITAPLIQAQLVETAVINLCHFQTLIASKAARGVIAARGRPVIDFGLRRSHGADAGMKAARCAFIAGVGMTSNVLAGRHYGIPLTGTMAHSYVAAFPREIDAFRAFARAFPADAVLLIDTYDTSAGARKAATVAKEMEARGERLAGVRLDSGDLAALSREVRRILDRAGLPYVRVVASGGLDEESVERLLQEGAPIDSFALGTRTDVSADAPYLDIAYKIVKYDGRHVLKTSAGKETWTSDKQVYRFGGPRGRFEGDLLALREEPPPAPEAQPLLATVMRSGSLVDPHPPLKAARDRCAAQMASLPPELLRLKDAGSYAVRCSDRLMALQRRLKDDLTV